MNKIKHIILRIILKKELKELLERRNDYWTVMNSNIEKQEYYQTRRCELERIINYLFGLNY